MTDTDKTTDRAPLHMRLFLWLGLSIMRMDFTADYRRAKAGERWTCLCGSILGRGFLLPLWRAV